MTRYAQKTGLKGFIENRPFPDEPRWVRALAAMHPVASRIIWAILNRRHHGGEEPPLREKVQTSTYGNPIPRCYGKKKVAGNIIWATDIQPTVLEGNYDGHGHLVGTGEGEDPPLGCSLAVAVCAGPIDGIARIWANDTVIYDAGNPGYRQGPEINVDLKIYLGTETQTADSTIEADVGAGQVPGYRGLAYVVLRNFILTAFGDSVPRFEFEVLDASATSFPVNTVTVSPIVADQHELSKIGPWLYALTSSKLSKIDREQGTLLRQYDVQATLLARVAAAGGFSGALFRGHLCFDETTDTFYFFCRSVDTRSFIISFGFLVSDNYTSRTPEESTELEGIVWGDYLYTASGSGVTRAYDKRTLLRRWTRNGSADMDLCSPGNWTFDNAGHLWLISYNPSDDATGPGSRFFLSRITPGGVVYHQTITGLGRCKQVSYDAGRNRLICGGGDGGDLVRVHASGSLSPEVLSGKTADNQRSLFVSQRRVTGTSYWAFDGTDYHEIDLTTWTVLRSIAASSWAGVTHRGPAYDEARGSFWVSHDSSTLKEILFDRAADGSITVGDAIEDICVAAGLSPSQLDTTAITDDLEGYVLSDRASPRSALEPLLTAYDIGVRERDGRIEFRKLGTSSVVTIPEADLGAGEGKPLPEPYEETFAEEGSLPLRCEVTYVDADRDYTEGVQHYQRPPEVVSARGVVGLSLPVVLTADQARRLAENTVYRAWAERRGFNLSLPPRYFRLDAEDVVTLALADGSIRVRLENVELGANHLVRAKAVFDSTISYGSSISGVAGAPSRAGVVRKPPVIAHLIDTAILRDLEDDAGIVLAAAPDGDGDFPGATLRTSVDGVHYKALITTDRATPIGILETALPSSGGVYTFDRVNTVDVRLTYGTLSSLTEADLIDDPTKNLAAVGSAETGWELLNFTTATDLGSGLWRLSGLRRGRRGTEWAMSVHPFNGALVHFVVLDPSAVSYRRVVLPDAEIGQTRDYKAHTVYSKLTGVRQQSLQHTAAGLKPYAPVNLLGTRDATSHDWALAWTRRTRIGGQLQSGNGVPLGEDSESYQVEILDSDGAVVRTLDVGEPPSTSGVNLQAIASDQSFNRAGGSFITDGYVPGMRLSAAGFSNAANNGLFRVKSVTALKLIVCRGGPLVDEASSSGRTLTGITAGTTYSAAEQLQDFNGVIQTSITWRVYQISARAGRGYAASATS